MPKFAVPEMSCAHCTAAIEKGVKQADPAATVDCDLSDRTVSIQSGLDSATLVATIKDAGYAATPL
ncbi:MAG: heavy-metal-associated domain-containing protein [Jhaorihella sp.]